MARRLAQRRAGMQHSSAQIARRGALHYVTDGRPGIARLRRGAGFIYRHPTGKAVRDRRVLRRIRSLTIPPGWRDVWICVDARGHIQACGRDDAGRKQYRYHDRWCQISARTKFDHLLQFAAVLPKLRSAVDRDLHRPRLDRRRVVAGMVRILDLTLIRVGNDVYERDNGSYGLTTLHDEHVVFRRGRAVLSFNGKSGQHHERQIAERRLVRLVQDCHDLPGCRLFQYLDRTGRERSVYSQDVNRYIRAATGRCELGAKDFRTWGATVWASVILARVGPAGSPTQCKRNITAAVKEVSRMLGNRPAACRKYYIHPAVLAAYGAGSLTKTMARAAADPRPPRTGLSPEERAVVKLLQRAGRKTWSAPAGLNGRRSP